MTSITCTCRTVGRVNVGYAAFDVYITCDAHEDNRWRGVSYSHVKNKDDAHDYNLQATSGWSPVSFGSVDYNTLAIYICGNANYDAHRRWGTFLHELGHVCAWAAWGGIDRLALNAAEALPNIFAMAMLGAEAIKAAIHDSANQQ